MCSIGGWIAQKPLEPWEAERLTRALLYYGQDRGSQSAGVYVNGSVLRAAVHPLALACREDFSNLFRAGARLCLTHTRQPTSGGRGDEQAQPFVRPGTVTVHNGSFINAAQLKQTYALTKPSGVDSELATDFIETYGIKALPEFLRSAWGSAALAIVKRDAMSGREKVYLARDGGPISTATILLPQGNRITVWASTERMAANALRNVWLIQDVPVVSLKDRALYAVSSRGPRLAYVTPEMPRTVESYDSRLPLYYRDGGLYGETRDRWAPKPREKKRKRGVKPPRVIPMPEPKSDADRSQAEKISRYFRFIREGKTPLEDDTQAFLAWQADGWDF